MRPAVLLLALASFASAETGPGKLWRWSIAALLAGASADVATSYGALEANPLLRNADGRLGAKGVGIKFGILGGAIIGQALLVRRRPETARALGAANLGVGAALAGIAVRNSRTR